MENQEVAPDKTKASDNIDDNKFSDQGNETGQGQQQEDVEANKEKQQQPQEEQNFKDRYFYLAAELENFKKRSQRDMEGMIKFGNEKILGDLIDVIDNFERIVKAVAGEQDKKIRNMAQGVEMVKKQFEDTLQKYGLQPIEALGKEFDPNFHEAVSQKVKEGSKDQEILEVFQKGYLLNGRLLRPAKVVLAKPENENLKK